MHEFVLLLLYVKNKFKIFYMLLANLLRISTFFLLNPIAPVFSRFSKASGELQTGFFLSRMKTEAWFSKAAWQSTVQYLIFMQL
jgi:hypothetical protein